MGEREEGGHKEKKEKRAGRVKVGIQIQFSVHQAPRPKQSFSLFLSVVTREKKEVKSRLRPLVT